MTGGSQEQVFTNKECREVIFLLLKDNIYPEHAGGTTWKVGVSSQGTSGVDLCIDERIKEDREEVEDSIGCRESHCPSLGSICINAARVRYWILKIPLSSAT